jgi:hypothetical protein
MAERGETSLCLLFLAASYQTSKLMSVLAGLIIISPIIGSDISGLLAEYSRVP